MLEAVPLFTFPILLITALLGINVFYNYKFTKDAINQDLESGNVVAFSGKVDSRKTKTSPITSESVIFYDYEVRSSKSNDETKTLEQKGYRSDDFKLRADGETVKIDSDSNFQNDLVSRRFSIQETPLGGAEDIEKFDYAKKVEDYIDGPGNYITYSSVTPNEEITVIGELTLTDDGKYKIIEATQSKLRFVKRFDNNASERIILYDGSPKEYISKNKKWMLISAVVFVVLCVITVYSLYTAI